MLYWDAPHFQVEGLQQHGPNVMSFQVASVVRSWFIVGCYLAPNDEATTERVVATIVQSHQARPLLRVVYFNTELTAPEGNIRGEDIVAAIMTARLEDMSVHFLRAANPWHRMGGRGGYAAVGGRCGPRRTTFWEQTAVCSI